MPRGLVGKLSVGLSLSAGAFTKGLDRARGRLSKFKKESTALSRGLRATGAAFAITGALAVRSIQRNLEYIDSLAKMSTRLGITTEKLSELHFAARLSGVEITALNTGLQRMIRRVNQASTGTGEAVDTLKELGLDAKELSLLSPDKMFLRIADATSKLATEGAKVTAFFKLFDTEGVGLKVVAEGGAAGIEDMARQAREAGAVIGMKMAKDAERLNDAMVKLNASTNAFGLALLDVVAEPLTDIANLMTWLLRGAQAAGDFFVGLGVRGLGLDTMGPRLGRGSMGGTPGAFTSDGDAVAELKSINATLRQGSTARAG